METQLKLKPTAGRAGREAPTPPAMTTVVGESRAPNKGWCRRDCESPTLCVLGQTICHTQCRCDVLLFQSIVARYSSCDICGLWLKFARHMKTTFIWKTTGQLFRETAKQVSGQTETTGISMISFQGLRCVSTSLLHSRAYQSSTAKVYVFSDSVLCLGKMGNDPVESWKSKIQWY